MPGALSNLLEDLALSYPDGSPAIVTVTDYRERGRLADALVEGAKVFGIDLIPMVRSEDVMARLPTLSARSDQAALILVDAGAAGALGPWLEAARESLPEWVRFLILLVVPQEVPIIAKTAPAFLSWAKGLEIRELSGVSRLPSEDLKGELKNLQRETGMSPSEFIEAWERGALPDTFRNTSWLNLAWAARHEEA